MGKIHQFREVSFLFVSKYCNFATHALAANAQSREDRMKPIYGKRNVPIFIFSHVSIKVMNSS